MVKDRAGQRCGWYPKTTGNNTSARLQKCSISLERGGAMAKAMALSRDQIASLVISTLTAEERRSSVIYLDDQSLSAGAELKIDGQNVDVPWAAVVAFVDLEPEMNWGHDCRYVLVNLETGELKVINAHLPPFLLGIADTLRVIWHGTEVPEWTLVC